MESSPIFTGTTQEKSTVEIFQNFVAFSEYTKIYDKNYYRLLLLAKLPFKLKEATKNIFFVAPSYNIACHQEFKEPKLKILYIKTFEEI